MAETLASSWSATAVALLVQPSPGLRARGVVGTGAAAWPAGRLSTLLGPEATGPRRWWCPFCGVLVVVWVCLFLVLPAMTIMHGDSFGGCVWGVWCGVVV
jgi:hypothetical protein